MSPRKPVKIPPGLLLAIHEAAADPRAWPEALARITSWVGGDVGSLLATRPADKGADTNLVVSGIAPEDHPAHPRHQQRRPSYAARLARLPVGRAVLLRDALQSSLRSPRGELARKHQLTDLQGIVLHRDANWRVSLGTFGRRGRRFDERTRHRLEVVGHHLHQALRLGRRFETVGSDSDSGLQIATRMGLVHALEVDRELRLLSGHERWQRDQARDRAEGTRTLVPLHIEQQRLRARDAHDQPRLLHAVQQATLGKQSVLSFEVGEQRALVGFAPGPWISPLGHERAALVIMPPLWSGRATPEDDPFGKLPKALREVAEQLALGRTDKEIAISMGLSLASARTYVARTMKRLGINNRRELMRR
ncbi:MAG: helix-turn-helix transcriptional regulator [Myxococcales bacterium]